MATSKPKESFGLGKERKITPPNSVTIPTNTPTKRTPKSSPRGIAISSFSSASPSSSSSSSSSSNPSLSILPEKHVPNYLKSTASSRQDHNFKSITRSKSNAAPPAPIPEGKPSLNRRRSFDKPPPTAPRLEKPFRSPGPRDRPAHVPVRSSSFGAKSSTTTNNTIVNSTKGGGVLERSSSKIKVGGKLSQQPIHSLKNSNSNVKKSFKRESSNAAAAEAVAPKTKNAVENVDQTPNFVLGVNEEDLKKIECELDPYLPDPSPELLDKQLRIDQVEKKAVLDEADKVGKEEEVETPDQAAAENPVANRERIEADGRVGEEEEEEGEPKEEEKPKRSISVEKEEINTNNKNNDEEKSEIEGVLDGESYKEENDDQKTVEIPEKEGEGTEKAAKPRQGGPGRKESPAMYNDVIEETASKLLLEKRKNKVRALAGAFQTVIDYESSSK